MDTAHLQPDFDPSNATAAFLRGVFVEHGVAYSSAMKKGELVAVYEERVRPFAATWLRERERARASSAGIEDHREGANEPVQAPAATAPKKRGRPPKSASMNNLASVANSKPSGRRSSVLPSSASTTSIANAGAAAPRRAGMRRSASVEIVQDSQDDGDDEERAVEGDSDVPVPVAAAASAPKKRGRPPKKSVTQAPSMERLQEEDAVMPMEIDGEEDPPPILASRSNAFRPSVPTAPGSVQRRTSSGLVSNSALAYTNAFADPPIQLSPSGRAATVEVVIPDRRRRTIGGEVLESGHKVCHPSLLS